MALICACAPAMKGFFSGLSNSAKNRYPSKNRSTDRSNHLPLGSNNTTPQATLIQRDGQLITLHETLRGDEYLDKHESSFWNRRPGEQMGGEVGMKYIEEPYYRGTWGDSDLRSQSDATWTAITEAKSSDEILSSPGRRARVQDGGILITETFSVERGSDPYAQERRVLGL